jgi:cytochrome d ubiquinol oxidase subunit II
MITVLAILNVAREINRRQTWHAFLSSCAAVLGLMALVGVGMYPKLVNALEGARSLTIYNSASTPDTLRRMAILAAITGPLIVSYTVGVYRVFRGKVQLDATSY